MGKKTILLLGAAAATVVAPAALAQTSRADERPAVARSSDSGDVVVTARKRAETLLDVPVAVSSVSGDTLARRNINSVREAAQLVPGLNISSDGAGRAFVAIRGVGATLVQTVQPGVGLFVDGVYRPSTAYLNNPLLDVARLEVLRGPQGTLYGKNTLGGAITIVTRQPGNRFEMRAQTSYAGPDGSGLISGSVSGPIIQDRLQIRVAASHREQDGFLRNITIGGDANRLATSSANTTIRVLPTAGLTVMLNGYYDDIIGSNSPYARVTSITDYRQTNSFNTLGRVHYRYYGGNARVEAPVDAIDTKITLIAAYDGRTTHAPDTDGDFGAIDTIRQSSRDRLSTRTAEMRLDTQASAAIASLVGLFYSHETLATTSMTRIHVPAPGVDRQSSTYDRRVGDSYAAFATMFWTLRPGWEVALGVRLDHEDRTATGTIRAVAIPEARLRSDQVDPRLSLTRRWARRLMSYASVSRGYRGGGFNAPTAPLRTYRGDYAWTYELGTKYVSRRVSLSGDVFYNDYHHYIGLNSVAPAATGGLVTVDLNAGHVHSQGAELEARLTPTEAWTLSGSITYAHARLIDISDYVAVTGRTLSSDRLTFQPDWTWTMSSDYVVALPGSDTLTLGAGVVGKGSRLAATLNQTVPTILRPYALVNGSVTWHRGACDIAVFATNLLNKRYFEAYIEQTTLRLAGLPASDLGLVGDLRRYGVRLSFTY